LQHQPEIDKTYCNILPASSPSPNDLTGYYNIWPDVFLEVSFKIQVTLQRFSLGILDTFTYYFIYILIDVTCNSSTFRSVYLDV
jgi:hypothetical protein